MASYYNEIDPYAAQWLRNLIEAGHIAPGEVDTRSIVDVGPDDLRGFTQCHFFAGLGGWPHAARLAGWPDDRPIWTGSCPCQPFSVAGKGAGVDDPRHLWPHFFRLIRACRPPVVMGEQVAGSAGYGWLDGVVADLASEGYASRGVDIPACSVDAPHIRSRLYWVAVADALRAGRAEGRAVSGAGSAAGHGRTHAMADADAHGRSGIEAARLHERWTPARRDEPAPGNADRTQRHDADGRSAPVDPQTRNGTFWSDHVWLTGADGKARRAQPGLPLLAHGIPGRVGRLRAYGNAIVPQIAAEVIRAYADCEAGQ
jgi:DNA (cytosine-5)-methyltransferase 1